MPEDRPYVTQIHAVIAKDGRPVVVAEWPDGTQILFERDEAVRFSVTMLASAAKLFPTASEFSNIVSLAQSGILNLHPDLNPAHPQ